MVPKVDILLTDIIDKKKFVLIFCKFQQRDLPFKIEKSEIWFGSPENALFSTKHLQCALGVLDIFTRETRSAEFDRKGGTYGTDGTVIKSVLQ